jgi:hypothetical protein
MIIIATTITNAIKQVTVQGAILLFYIKWQNIFYFGGEGGGRGRNLKLLLY